MQTDCTSAFVSQTFLARAGGAVAPVNFFLSSTLITMQNLVTVSHTKCTHADPKIWGMLWPHPLGLGVADPRNMPLPMCNHVKFGCSMSNDKSVHTEICQGKWASHVPFFKVTGIDTDQSATYDFLLVIHSNHRPIPYHF